MAINNRENGRSERIRTSDPLLPKQVRYQAALRSDRRWGRYRAKGANASPNQLRCGHNLCMIVDFGVVTVSLRIRDDVTGRLTETPPRPSRATM